MPFADVRRLRDDDVLATKGSERERGRDAIEYLKQQMEAPPDPDWNPTPQIERRRQPRSA